MNRRWRILYLYPAPHATPLPLHSASTFISMCIVQQKSNHVTSLEKTDRKHVYNVGVPATLFFTRTKFNLPQVNTLKSHAGVKGKRKIVIANHSNTPAHVCIASTRTPHRKARSSFSGTSLLPIPPNRFTTYQPPPPPQPHPPSPQHPPPSTTSPPLRTGNQLSVEVEK